MQIFLHISENGCGLRKYSAYLFRLNLAVCQNDFKIATSSCLMGMPH